MNPGEAYTRAPGGSFLAWTRNVFGLGLVRYVRLRFVRRKLPIAGDDAFCLSSP